MRSLGSNQQKLFAKDPILLKTGLFARHRGNTTVSYDFDVYYHPKGTLNYNNNPWNEFIQQHYIFRMDNSSCFVKRRNSERNFE